MKPENERTLLALWEELDEAKRVFKDDLERISEEEGVPAAILRKYICAIAKGEEHVLEAETKMLGGLLTRRQCARIFREGEESFGRIPSSPSR